MSKKITLGGLILVVASFFLHPDQCISSTSIIQKLLPSDFDAAATHIGLVVGTILMALGGSLLKSKEVK